MKHKSLVRPFVKDVLYQVEITKFKNKETAKKLVLNRVRYLKKKPHELTYNDIMDGFSKSGIHKGAKKIKTLDKKS